VRLVGEALGLPETLVWRQPFPGPGLAVRCLGEVNRQRLERLRAADVILTGELEKAGLLRMSSVDRSISSSTAEGSRPSGTAQAFAVLLPVQSVGVMGDQRTYQETIALRAVTTEDFMTADWARLALDLLARVANRIVNARCAASIAWSTTSPASRRPPLMGIGVRPLFFSYLKEIFTWAR